MTEIRYKLMGTKAIPKGDQAMRCGGCSKRNVQTQVGEIKTMQATVQQHAKLGGMRSTII